MKGDQTLVAAAIQMVSGSDILLNQQRAESLIREVVRKEGAQLILLPENFLCFSAKKYFDLAAEAQIYLDQFCRLAKELNVHLVLGSIPLAERSDGSSIESKVSSASIHIDRFGQISARYDKMHLFDVDVKDGHGAYRESNEFEPGDEAILTQIDSFNAGLSICYDLRFPGLYRQLRVMGADLLLVPAAFTEVTGEAHWEVLLRARAIETQCYVIAANQGGEHAKNRSTWGHSMIVDPWGRILSLCERGEGYCVAKLELGEVTNVRRSMPVFDHNRFK